MTAPPATDLFTQVVDQVVDFTAIPLDEMRSLVEKFSLDVIAMVRSGQCAESIQGQRD
jgi:hypothetical protein